MGARELVGTRYLADPALRQEYAREIAPRTEAALARVLGEVYGPSTVEPGQKRCPPPARALDLGAGTGAVGRALRTRFGATLEVIAVDVVEGPGVLRADLSRDLPATVGAFDLLVAAHLLNELYVDRPPTERIRLRAQRVLAWADKLLSPEGTIVLIEPALRATSRELLEVRTQLIAGGLQVVAPCLRQGACPALERERDWCHDAAPGTGRARVDFSYLVLRRAGVVGSPLELDADEARYRVVSDPLPEKGRLRLYGCGVLGRHELVRLDRDAEPGNAELDRAARGDVIRVTGVEITGDSRRIGRRSVVTRD